MKQIISLVWPYLMSSVTEKLPRIPADYKEWQCSSQWSTVARQMLSCDSVHKIDNRSMVCGRVDVMCMRILINWKPKQRNCRHSNLSLNFGRKYLSRLVKNYSKNGKRLSVQEVSSNLFAYLLTSPLLENDCWCNTEGSWTGSILLWQFLSLNLTKDFERGDL